MQSLTQTFSEHPHHIKQIEATIKQREWRPKLRKGAVLDACGNMLQLCGHDSLMHNFHFSLRTPMGESPR